MPSGLSTFSDRVELVSLVWPIVHDKRCVAGIYTDHIGAIGWRGRGQHACLGPSEGLSTGVQAISHSACLLVR